MSLIPGCGLGGGKNPCRASYEANIKVSRKKTCLNLNKKYSMLKLEIDLELMLQLDLSPVNNTSLEIKICLDLHCVII